MKESKNDINDYKSYNTSLDNSDTLSSNINSSKTVSVFTNKSKSFISNSLINSIKIESSNDQSILSLQQFKPFNHEYYDIFSLARHGRYNELENILLRGVDPDSRDMWGNTILIVGTQNGNKRIVKLALRYGGNINSFNHLGNTGLHFASQYKYYNIYEYLIYKGANQEILNIKGLKPKEGI